MTEKLRFTSGILKTFERSTSKRFKLLFPRLSKLILSKYIDFANWVLYPEVSQ